MILQHNDANAAVLERLTATNLAILFDRSGGRGLRPDAWPAADPTRPCGYAGGLTPETRARDLAAIARAAGDAPYWVDLESGLRDATGAFSLVRAADACAAVRIHAEARSRDADPGIADHDHRGTGTMSQIIQESAFLVDVLARVQRNGLIPATFQRPYRWERSDVLDLGAASRTTAPWACS